ncbi:hypothetical protein CDCA_CDCA05G1666 [Cyanidium caldarium]|uniref:Adenine DNA glycosylase n=1 Tax=Cyanidium caldarium TaxID=2771 RepID=A0AAV9ITZ5_CYACA|nr:hypothetical protein CDCA_CDCA05G1666 [Cyanidium caldarium]
MHLRAVAWIAGAGWHPMKNGLDRRSVEKKDVGSSEALPSKRQRCVAVEGRAAVPSGSVPSPTDSGPVALEDIPQVRTALLEWYDRLGRQLPWRYRVSAPMDVHSTAPAVDPYVVYVSELMLQQTRVGTVLEYFSRWMARFPTLQSLAEASEEEVLRLWAGLGYYRRARALHAGARYLVQHHHGRMPSDMRSLLRVPGVGVYTAGAIASIAFGQPVPAVDGNATRVLSRLCGLTESGTAACRQALWQAARRLVDPQRPGDWNQALFDLGSTVCTPRVQAADCARCPLHRFCRAYNTAGEMPAFQPRVSTKKQRQERVYAFVVVRASSDGLQLLLRKRPGTGLLAGLWEVPNVIARPPVQGSDGSAEGLESWLASEWLLSEPATAPACELLIDILPNSLCRLLPPVHLQSASQPVRHVFTHIRQELQVFRVQVAGDEQVTDADWQWLSADRLHSVGVSTQMRKVIRAALAIMDEDTSRASEMEALSGV